MSHWSECGQLISAQLLDRPCGPY